MKLARLAALSLSLVGSVAGCGRVDDIVGCRDFGASDDAVKVTHFLATAEVFATGSVELANGVEATCRAIATDLGVTPPAAVAGQLQVEASCLAVRDEIRAIVGAALPAGASLTLEYVPPACTIDVDVYGRCVAECDANVSVDADVRCQEGRLSGRCDGMCTGSCRVEGTVACEARCDGTCTGSCSGTCAGECDGSCTATDAEGRCAGQCEGTCSGSCSATCSGTCQGGCVADVEAACSGTCTGSCDVDFIAPRCEGDVMVEADVDCRAACEARVSASARCTEPSVAVYFAGDVDPAALERLRVLIASLERNFPRLYALEAQLALVATSGAELVSSFDRAAAAARRIGTRATACFVDATAVAADAASRVDVTLSVTVEVSASASATAG